MLSRNEQTSNLYTSVDKVRYAHGKRLDGLHELGIKSIYELLQHYPFRYDDFSAVVKIVNAKLGEKNVILGKIHEAKGRKTAKGGYVYEVTVTDGSGILRAVWFNQRWLADTLVVGREILLLGKTEHYNGFLNMASPLYTLISTESEDLSAKDSDTQAATSDKQIKRAGSGPAPIGIVPVYHASNKISSNWIKRIILESRKLVSEPLDPLPPALRIKRNMVSRHIAWHDIHTPQSTGDLANAHKRLAYEQIFWSQLRLAYTDKQLQRGIKAYSHINTGDCLSVLKENLPFELTQTQTAAINDILSDLQAPSRMNRLLLGDVGSGKTVVALFALVIAAQSGWQAAMMAPTEVLAQQYAEFVGTMLDKLGVTWDLLSSSLNASKRREVVEGLANGTVQVVFGTHALIEPDVIFKELSLIVIDEQHRFGVEHRNNLIKKSPSADFLSMTATPIPRSLALVQYGAIEVSYLANRPHKATVSTTSIDASVSYKAYEEVRRALGRGEQAYIVCPLISAPAPTDDDEFQYLDDLDVFVDEPYIAAAEAELQHLRQQVFPSHSIELLTSRVKSDDKKRIMDEFKSGKIDVLVSTTVIEVGIDVPNATVMIILDADRFGLAQLHQLRGRIGRGVKDSHVFLISAKPGDSARRRLRQLEATSDGLALAAADLAERREGDIAGTRQHGDNSLCLVNVIRDKDLIEAAHSDVIDILEQDPSLTHTEHQHILHELELANAVGAH